MLKKAIFLLLTLLLSLSLFACGEEAPPQGPETPETPDDQTPPSGGSNGNTQTSNVYDWNFLSDEGYDKDTMSEEEINALLERKQLRWEMSKTGTLTLKGVCTVAPTFYDDTDQPWRDFTTLQSNDAGDGRPVLKRVVVEPTVMVLPDFAFYGCAELETVTLSATLSEIPDYCFTGCESLTTVTGGFGLSRIGDYALSNCSKLQRIEVSEALSTVGHCAFDRSCDKLGTDSVTGETKQLLIYFQGDEAMWTALKEQMVQNGTFSPAGNGAFNSAVVLYVGQ